MDNLNPLVSVIIPNYNHARYLEQRLDSVFNQTYQNFEVIVLDDCSTDNSLEIIEKYKGNPHLSRIVVNETNTGSPFKQWNKGIGLANGELVWIAESDDYCELNMLEELVKAFEEKNNVALAFSSYVMFDDEGGKYVPPAHGTQYYSGDAFVSRWMTQECVVKNASGAIFRKSALAYVTDEYLRYKQCGDYMFWTMLAGTGAVAFVNKNLTYFRISSGSVTSRNISSGLFAFENKTIYDFICERYRPGWLARQIALASHHLNYLQCPFESEEVRGRILSYWGIANRSVCIDKRLLWLFSKMRVHFGVLL